MNSTAMLTKIRQAWPARMFLVAVHIVVQGAGLCCAAAQEPTASVLTFEQLLTFGRSWSTPPLPKFQWLTNSREVWHLTEGWLEIIDVQTTERRRLAQVNFAVFSPDGAQIAVLQGNKTNRELAVIDLDGQNLRRFSMVGDRDFDLKWQDNSQRFVARWTDGQQLKLVLFDTRTAASRVLAEIPHVGEHPKLVWSHSAKHAACIATAPLGKQLRVISCAEQDLTGRTYDLTGFPVKLLEPVWSPDDKEIAVVGYQIASPPVSRVLPVGEGSSAKVFTSTSDRLRFTSAIWTFQADGNGQRQVLKADHIVQYLAWSPDASKLAYVARFKAEDNFTSMGPMELRLVDHRTSQVRTLLSGHALGDASFSGVFDFSPDGQTIAAVTRPYDGFYVPRREIVFLPLNGGRMQTAQGNLPVWGGAFAWSADGSALYLSSKSDSAFAHVHALSTQGRITRLTQGLRNHSSPKLSPDRKWYLCSTEDQSGNRDVRIMRADGTSERILHDGATSKNNRFTKGEVSEVHWRSRDGVQSSGILVKPLGYQSGRRYPLLVVLHGGPASGIHLNGPILFNTPLEKHFWAGRGFMVFSPEYRSSGLLGRKSVENFMKRQDMFAGDLKDVVAGVDHLVKLGSVDPTRVAVTGHSWGAYVVNWLVTHSDRFQAAISFEGESDYALAYGTDLSLGGNTYWEGLFRGKPWEKPENYRRNSPAHSIKLVKTPTLFVNGSEGAALFHNQYLHTVLRQHGVDTQLVVYQGEGHSVNKPANQRDLLQRSVDWIDSHLTLP